MHLRAYLEPGQWNRPDIHLDAEESHHLAHVLRARAGQRVILFDGQGQEGEAEILHAGNRETLVRLLERHTLPPPPFSFTLIQALPKAQKMDWIIQKATELGVACIRPVITDHAVSRPDEDGNHHKAERWRKIALNAVRQCHAGRIPVVEDVRPLDAVLAAKDWDVLLTGSLQAPAGSLKTALRNLPAGTKRVAFGIGPEGDWSAREETALRQAGARPVSLGDTVLRVETAPLAALAVLNYELLH